MVTFISEISYQFMTYPSLGIPYDSEIGIKAYNNGIQFRGNTFTTDCPKLIKGLRAYTEGFKVRGVQPPVWEEDQEFDVQPIQEELKEEPTEEVTDRMKILKELREFIK